MASERAEVLSDWPRPSSTGEASIDARQRPYLISYVTDQDQIAVLEIPLCSFLVYGAPNDETLSGHPLYGNGLQFYAAHKVQNSKLLEQLESRNSAHPSHNRAAYLAGRSHYIITFQDATLEFVSIAISGPDVKVHVFQNSAQARDHFPRDVV
jgi:hypothetical protein